MQPVTLHVSVWVEIARHSWQYTWLPSHAPRERVSWNSQAICMIRHSVVTLHVSVWVEISDCRHCIPLCLVTLHVSVWVEIVTFGDFIWESLSRSTWACELKCHEPIAAGSPVSHAPRERVSWNIKDWFIQNRLWVTLHVSVWVEILSLSVRERLTLCHAPRERVSWNELSGGDNNDG